MVHVPAPIAFLKNELSSKCLRPTYLRLRVLESLHQGGTHPTVDEIYRVLLPEIPSLSKATIYNSLNTFVEVGLVRTVGIDGSQMRYDITLADHGHFQCEACGTIVNFAIDIERVLIDELSPFEIHEKNVYVKGFCPNCRPTTSPDQKKE